MSYLAIFGFGMLGYLAFHILQQVNALTLHSRERNRLLQEILDRQNDMINRSKYYATYGVLPRQFEHVGINLRDTGASRYIPPTQP